MKTAFLATIMAPEMKHHYGTFPLYGPAHSASNSRLDMERQGSGVPAHKGLIYERRRRLTGGMRRGAESGGGPGE